MASKRKEKKEAKKAKKQAQSANRAAKGIPKMQTGGRKGAGPRPRTAEPVPVVTKGVKDDT